MVAAIGRDQDCSAERAASVLVRAGLRAIEGLRGVSLCKEIVDASQAGVPVLAAVGAREQADGSIGLRWRDGRQQLSILDEAAVLLCRQTVPGSPHAPS